MSLTDLVIPPWVRVAACAAVVGLIFGAGYHTGGWVSDCRNAAKIVDAEHERDKAQNDLAANRLQVREAAAAQATSVAQQTIKQATITQESAHAYINHRSSLEQRIAAGGMHNATADRSGGCHLPAIASGPSRTDEGAPQPVPTDAGRDPGEAPVDAAAEVQPTQQVVDDAARDAQQLADLIEWVCRQGMCP